MKRSRRIDLSKRPRPSPRRRQTVGELRALQRLMAQAVMRPLTAGLKMNPRWIDGMATRGVVETFIKPGKLLDSFQRLQLYNRQYWFRLIDCFYEDYPGMRAVLGEERFARLAGEYLAAHPSASFTMRNLGRSLAAFIAGHREAVAPMADLALNMARLEWAHIEAFDNAAETPLTVDDFLDADPTTLRVGLQPHLSLLRLDYALDDYLIAVRKLQGMRQEASNAMENRRRHPASIARKFQRSKPIHLAVHRHRNSVFYKRLSGPQFVLLSALREGVPLGEALGKAIESGTAATFDPQCITVWFRDWAALGWFCRGPD